MDAAPARLVARALLWVLVIASLGAIWLEAPRALPGADLMDFGSFLASGRAAGQGLNPYGIHPLTFHVSFPGFEAWNPNLNPPISAILFRVFDIPDAHHAFRVWWWFSFASYAAAVALLVRRFGGERPWAVAIWALALAGFWDTLVLGQIYLPLVLAGVAAWILLERGRDVAAGVLIGLVVAMKPNFAVWPGLLFLAGHRRPGLVAGLTAGAVSLVPLLAHGTEIYRQWLELVASDRDRAAFLTNASLAGLAARVGAPGLGLAFGLAILAVASAWAHLARPAVARASGVGILASLLASPLAWIHYTLFLAPFLLSRWDRPSARLVSLALVVPVPWIIHYFGQPPLLQATYGSLYNWALLGCLGMVVVEEARLLSAAPPGARDLASGPRAKPTA